MGDLIKTVRTYNLTGNLADRLRLGDEIFRTIEPDLRYFVCKAIQPSAADDVLQEILKSIAGSLEKFQGSTSEQFWEWCYTITRRRICDHIRKKKSDRLQPLPPEEMIKEIDTLMRVEPVSLEVMDELEYALSLVKRSKPECFQYLVNHYLNGMDHGDIAEELEIDEAAARMRVTRCLEKAQELLADYAKSK